MDASENMGSHWIFYPYHFITNDSGLTINESPYGLERFNGKRLKTVQKAFNDFYNNQLKG